MRVSNDSGRIICGSLITHLVNVENDPLIFIGWNAQFVFLASLSISQPGGSYRLEVCRVGQWHPPKVNRFVLAAGVGALHQEAFLISI
jgi:hypothetical protein